MEINFQPGVDLKIKLSFDSPHVVLYDAWYKRPEDALHIKFASGKDQKDIDLSTHNFTLKNLPQNTLLTFELIFAGNPNTPYKSSITLSQGGIELDTISPITGTTNNKGVDSETIEINLV